MPETYSDIAERELAEAATVDRQSRDDEGEDRLATLLGFTLIEAPEAEYVSKERVVVSYPNGYADYDEEVEDERDCELN